MFRPFILCRYLYLYFSLIRISNFHLLSSVAILILSVNYSTFSRLCNCLVAGGGAARWAGAVRRAVLAEAHPGSKAALGSRLNGLGLTPSPGPAGAALLSELLAGYTTGIFCAPMIAYLIRLKTGLSPICRFLRRSACDLHVAVMLNARGFRNKLQCSLLALVSWNGIENLFESCRVRR